MCGIIGFVGNSSCEKFLLSGLERLEYRGYDSAGIAVFEKDDFLVLKTDKRIESLKKLCASKTITGNIGIGHTRWATHGKPDVKNAHPHISMNGKIAVVHNGIIENYSHHRKEHENESVSLLKTTPSFSSSFR